MNIIGLKQNNVNKDKNLDVVSEMVKIAKIKEEDYKPHIGRWEKALQYRQENSLGYRDSEGVIQRYPICIEENKLAKHGVGLELFFSMIKYFIIIFFIMGIISLPSLYSNYTGNGLKTQTNQDQYFLFKFALPNQPALILKLVPESATLDQKLAIKQENNENLQNYLKDLQSRQYWITIPDFIYSLFFLIMIFILKRKHRQSVKISKEQNLTPSCYALEVKGFSEKFNDEEALKQHFNQFGKVYECTFARNYYGTLLLHSKKALIMKDIEQLQVKLSHFNQNELDSIEMRRLKSNLEKITQELEVHIKQKFGENKPYNQYPTLKAFIIFDSRQVRNKLHKEYKQIEGAHWCYCLLPCLKPKYPENYKLNGTVRLTVSADIDEPSNIKWENLDATKSDRFQRSLVVMVLVFIVLVLTIILLFVANFLKPAEKVQNCPNQQYNMQEVIKTDNDKLIECFCKAQNPKDVYQNQELKDLCLDTQLMMLMQYIIQIVAAFGVVLINYILKAIIRKLTEYARYPTFSLFSLGNTTKLLYVLFINTAIIPLLFNAEVYGIKPKQIVGEIIPIQNSGTQVYLTDFDRIWYIKVGDQIQTTMIINILIPHLFTPILASIFLCLRQKRAKGEFLQSKMNQLALYSEFPIQEMYANLLNTIFVTLFYCSGIPVLLFIAFFSFCIQYLVNKYILLRFSRRPPAYDQKLNKRIIQLFPYAMILHLLMGIFMYSSPLLMPDDTEQYALQINQNFSELGVDIDLNLNSVQLGNTFFNRFFKVIFLLILLILIITLLLFDATVLNFLKTIKNGICGKSAKVVPENPDAMAQAKGGTYTEEYEAMSLRMLASYDIRKNDDYKELIDSIDGRFSTDKDNLNTEQPLSDNRQQGGIKNRKRLTRINAPINTKEESGSTPTSTRNALVKSLQINQINPIQNEKNFRVQQRRNKTGLNQEKQQNWDNLEEEDDD